MPLSSKCFAPIDANVRREKHNISLGKRDGKTIISCSWCGKTLEEFSELMEAQDACRLEQVRRALDGYPME